MNDKGGLKTRLIGGHMKKFFRNLWARFFGVEGAAITSKLPVYFWDIYELDDDTLGWFFSWRTEDYSQGEVLGPFATKLEAIQARNRWQYAPIRKGCVLVKG